ncbi:MAG: pentapeptide repeat-containing protein [Pseudomonadota bacterium]
MLRQFAALCFTALLASAPALAQDASEIARVKGGEPCEGCNLFQADMSFSVLKNTKVANSRLRQSNMSLAIMDGSDFRNTNLSVANLFGARLTGANFTRSNLQRATLVGAHLGGADLTGADLTDANLSGAELDTAKGLTQDQLSVACGDRYTRLPEGFTIPQC